MQVQIYFQFYVHINVELYVVTTAKKYFTEYNYGYVYITKHKYVIRRCCLLCETLVEHSTNFVEASQKRRSLIELSKYISDRSEA